MIALSCLFAYAKFGLPVLPHESISFENLPDQEQYEVSYNHRDTVTYLVVTKSVLIMLFLSIKFVAFVNLVQNGLYHISQL